MRSLERRESRALATALRIPWRAVEEAGDEGEEERGENARVEAKFPRRRTARTSDDLMVDDSVVGFIEIIFCWLLDDAVH